MKFFRDFLRKIFCNSSSCIFYFFFSEDLFGFLQAFLRIFILWFFQKFFMELFYEFLSDFPQGIDTFLLRFLQKIFLKFLEKFYVECQLSFDFFSGIRYGIPPDGRSETSQGVGFKISPEILSKIVQLIVRVFFSFEHTKTDI